MTMDLPKDVHPFNVHNIPIRTVSICFQKEFLLVHVCVGAGSLAQVVAQSTHNESV